MKISGSIWYYFISSDRLCLYLDSFLLWQCNLGKRLFSWQGLKLQVGRKYFKINFQSAFAFVEAFDFISKDTEVLKGDPVLSLGFWDCRLASQEIRTFSESRRCITEGTDSFSFLRCALKQFAWTAYHWRLCEWFQTRELATSTELRTYV